MPYTIYNNNSLFLGTNNQIENTPNFYSEQFLNGQYPLANVKDRLLSKKARTNNGTKTGSIFFQFDSPKIISCLGILSHNFSKSGFFSIAVYSGGDGSSTLYQNPSFNAWHPDITNNEIANTNSMSYDVFDPVLAGSFRIGFNDVSNPMNYLEIGRIFVGDAFQPKINMSYGVEFGYQIRTTVEETLDGTDYFDVRKPRKTVNFALDGLSENEFLTKVYPNQRLMGLDKEIMFLYKIPNERYSYQRNFLARNLEVSAISNPFLNRYSNPMSLIEII